MPTHHALLAALSCALASASAHSPVDRPSFRLIVEGLRPPFTPSTTPGTRLTDRMRDLAIPGLSLAIIDDGQVQLERAFGMGGGPIRGRLDPNWTMQAGTASPVVAAVLAADLADDSALDLDSPVSTLLRSWTLNQNGFDRERPATLRLLLSNAAGTTVSRFWGYAENDPLPTLLQTLEGLDPAYNDRVEVRDLPGASRHPSAGGVAVAQLAIEDATSADYASLARQRVLEPAAMARSTFADPTGFIAWPHHDAPWFDAQPMRHPELAAASLWTTAGDLARLLADVRNSWADGSGAILSQRAARDLLTPIIRDYQPWNRRRPAPLRHQLDQATAFVLRSKSGAPTDPVYAGFQGESLGYRTTAWIDLASGDGAVVMSNASQGQIVHDELIASVARAYQWPGFLPDEDARDVRFLLPGHQDARSVFVSGSFDEWRGDVFQAVPTAQGWSVLLALAPGEYEYKFVVNSATWILDPNNPATRDDGEGNVNSLLVVQP